MESKFCLNPKRLKNGAGVTYRWEREVTSAKMPSGRVEMSLPCRDLRREEVVGASLGDRAWRMDGGWCHPLQRGLVL